MAANDDQLFYSILQWLARNQDVLSEMAGEGKVDDEVYTAAVRHPRLDEHLVSSLTEKGHSADIDGRRPRACIWLDPVTKGDQAVPMLSPHWDFRKPESRSIHLYIGLYFRDGKWDRVDGVGFRYEAPHGSGDEIGMHDFFHAQPIMDFAEGAGLELPVQGRTQPESTPAFPLEASTAAELLVCMLISLYGGSYVTTMQQSGISGIGPLLSRLACCRRAS